MQVGILEAARSGNAPSNSECQTALRATKSFHGAKTPAIPDEALAVLWKIQHVMKYDEVPVLFDFTALVYLAGYLAFVCEEKVRFSLATTSPDLARTHKMKMQYMDFLTLQVTCPACKLQLKGKASREGAYQFVFSLDQGGLSYPRPQVVWLCKLVCTFAEKALHSAEIRRCGQICKLLSSAVLPHLTSCPLMWCSACRDPYHCEELCELFIKKLLRPLLANWAGDLNSSLENILKLSRKPLSRKVLRL